MTRFIPNYAVFAQKTHFTLCELLIEIGHFHQKYSFISFKNSNFYRKKTFLIKNDSFLPNNFVFAQNTLFTKNRLTTNYLTDKSVNGHFVGINFFLWLFDGKFLNWHSKIDQSLTTDENQFKKYSLITLSLKKMAELSLMK